MDIFVNYSCEENSQTGRTKITVSDFDSTSIRDVKYAIQEAIQAPVCDQQLFYQGQRLTDDNMPLSRLYFREGDCFKVQFLAAANISGMREFLDTLKYSARQIVENYQEQFPVHAIRKLSFSFFKPWKSLRSIAQKHYFVQEGGFEAFLEVFKFSARQFFDQCSRNSSKTTTILPQRKYRSRLFLQECCLEFLWNFGETAQDRKFLLSKDVFSLAVDIFLLARIPEDIGRTAILDRMVVSLTESALGFFAGLVEFDSDIQEEVSKMSPVIDKLIFLIDKCHSEPARYPAPDEYSLYSCQGAAYVLFYCTFNVKSAGILVDCGALGKILSITRKLLASYSDIARRYCCCMFLARMRSAPLVTLDTDTCVAIDQLIDIFLSTHDPSKISKWEEESDCVWVTMQPMVHLAFAAGKEYYRDQFSGFNFDGKERKGALEGKQSSEESLVDEAQTKGSQKTVSNKEESTATNVEDELATFTTLCDISEGKPTETSMSGDQNCAVIKKNQVTWAGSESTQRLGIFSVVHMLSIKENQQLALSQNLLPYLVCLSWHLKCDERKKLRNSLGDFYNASTPPSLKVAAKSVLALVYGFDIVFKK